MPGRGTLPGSHHLQPALLPGAVHWRDMPKGLGMRGNGHRLQFGNKEKIFRGERGAGSSPEMAAETSSGWSQSVSCLPTATKGTAAPGLLDPTVKVRDAVWVCACLFVPVRVPPIRGQDPAPCPQPAAWEDGPQEELQHSCSTHHSPQINN